MSFLIVLAIVAAALFITVYVTRRRVGVLGLGLAAGAILSNLWVGDLTPFVAQAGIEIVRPPLSSVVATVITLLPALILLFGGPGYKGTWQRIVGSLVFAVLAIVFLLEPLGAALVVDESGKPVFEFLQRHQNILITAGLGFAVIDLLFTRSPKAHKEH